MIRAIENTECISYDLLPCTLYGIATTDIDFNQDTFPFYIYQGIHRYMRNNGRRKELR